MQFQVPQFIEVEDKIFGPLTFRQFLYLAGGVGGSVLFIIYLPIILAIPLVLALAGFALALAFYKKNGKAFIDILEAAFYYYIGSKLYIWKKADKKPEATLQNQVQQMKGAVQVPKMSESKLKDLAWSLDIKQGLGSMPENEK